LVAFARLVGRNRRRYGGYVVHAAVVLLAIGVAGSSAYQTERERKLSPGQSLSVRGYRLEYRALEQRRTKNARELRALVDVYRGGDHLARLRPGKNQYFPAAGLFSNEVAIRSNWLNGEDLYLVADRIDRDRSVYFKVWVKPLVNLIWSGGFVFVLGSLVAMWPDAVEQRRLVERYGRGRARVAAAS
jgi:cytochrome c-type biogenesis protein CcmF